VKGAIYLLLLCEGLELVVVEASDTARDLLGGIGLLEAVKVVHSLTLLAGLELAEPGSLLPVLLDLGGLKSTTEGGAVAGVGDDNVELGHAHAADGKDVTGNIKTLDKSTVGVDNVKDNDKLASEVAEGDNRNAANADGVSLHDNTTKNKNKHNFILTCAHSISQEDINSKITIYIVFLSPD